MRPAWIDRMDDNMCSRCSSSGESGVLKGVEEYE